MFEDGHFYTPDRRAKFLFAEPRPLPEATNPDFPLLLLTGRGSSAQWHTQTRTKRSEVLRELSPSELYLELSPVDAKALSVQPNERVAVSSRRATIQARAFVTNAVKPGQVFMPMHYETMNQLTFASFDPYSRQPSYKACAIRVDKLEDTLLET